MKIRMLDYSGTQERTHLRIHVGRRPSNGLRRLTGLNRLCRQGIVVVDDDDDDEQFDCAY